MARALPRISTAPAPPRDFVVSDSYTTRVLTAHNRERTRLGLAPLMWDARLADAARIWASELAATGRFEHSPSHLRRMDGDDTGENLYMGTGGAFSPEAMIADFISERADFTPGTFPQVARTGDWHGVGHYTQIIWRRTRAVGCATVRGVGPDRRGNDYLVCRYWPAGNVFGQRVG
ncbi:SCP-like extracellular [Novosphingobium sp. FSY-8]|uniref:SCP-like extracellular n=2 Tax=Novosphingobium ovatum TaxID=1908523 RepID=A0ABW9XCM1_9SPHN|nr:SCP-like extracellular [Novosphingobium ovatum]